MQKAHLRTRSSGRKQKHHCSTLLANEKVFSLFSFWPLGHSANITESIVDEKGKKKKKKEDCSRIGRQTYISLTDGNDQNPKL
jgi:hypothetical protein